MNSDIILIIAGGAAVVILLSLWRKIRSLENDFMKEEKKMGGWSENKS